MAPPKDWKSMPQAERQLTKVEPGQGTREPGEAMRSTVPGGAAGARSQLVNRARWSYGPRGSTCKGGAGDRKRRICTANRRETEEMKGASRGRTKELAVICRWEREAR